MAKPDTWMPLYIGDYLADTQHLGAEHHGAYLLLIMAAWMRGGRLPDDDAQLARMARCDSKAWKRVRPIVAAFFCVDAGEWTHKRISAELERAIENSAKAEAKARKAATARWLKHPAGDAQSTAQSTAESNAPSMLQALPQGVLEQCPSPSPTEGLRPSMGGDPPTPPRASTTVAVAELVADGVDRQHAVDWLFVRKAKRLPLTPSALAKFRSDAARAGKSLPEAVALCAQNGWAGFYESDDPQKQRSDDAWMQRVA